MYIDKVTKKIIQDNQSYDSSSIGIRYPKNWDKSTISDLERVTLTPAPTDKYVIGYTIDDNYNQVWETREFTTEEIEEKIADVKTNRLNALDVIIKENLNKPISYLNTLFTNTEKSIVNLSSNYVLMDNTDSYLWIDLYGTEISLTKAQFKELMELIRDHRSTVYYHEASKKEEINNIQLDSANPDLDSYNKVANKIEKVEISLS